jgi:hypothetical protein
MIGAAGVGDGGPFGSREPPPWTKSVPPSPWLKLNSAAMPSSIQNCVFFLLSSCAASKLPPRPPRPRPTASGCFERSASSVSVSLPARRPFARRWARCEGAADSQDPQRRRGDRTNRSRALVARGRARRGRRDHRSDAGARRHLRRRHRLHHRSAARRSLRAHRRKTVPRQSPVWRLRTDSRRRVHQTPAAACTRSASRRKAGRRATTTSTAYRCVGFSSRRR